MKRPHFALIAFLGAALAASPAAGWEPPSFPYCVSERFDLGACSRITGWRTSRENGWVSEPIYRTPTPWTARSKLLAGGLLLTFVGDIATTAYALNSCDGLRELNPLLPSGSIAAPLVLAGFKLVLASATWMLGESFGGKHRDLMWGIGLPVNVAIVANNVAMIAGKCQ